MSYIGQQLPADVFSGFVTDSFTGDGSATTFTLSKAPFSEDTLIVVINNVIQKPTTNFTVSGTTLTIVGTAVASGDVIYAIHTGGAIPITTPGDNSVTSAKLSGNLVTPGTLDVNGQELILDADADTSITADTDDQIDFKAGGTDRMSVTSSGVDVTGAITASSASSINVTGGSALTLKSTDAGSSAGPVLLLDRDSASPANSDELGAITFRGRNDADQDIDFIKIKAKIADDTDGTEDGTIVFESILGGTARTILQTNHGELCLNEDSQNFDFRVESDAHEHFLFVDASESALTVGSGGGTNEGLLTLAFPTSGAYSINNNVTAGSGNVYCQKNTYPNRSPDDNTSSFYWGNDSVTARFGVYSDGDVKNHDNSYGSFSDERIKQDIRDANSQWDDIKAVKVRNYKKKDDVRQYGDKAWEQIGVIAQELEAAGMDKLIKHSDPSAGDITSDSSFGTLYEDGDDIPMYHQVGDVKEVKSQVKGVSYTVLYMKALKALQEAMAKIETLETKVKALEDA